jgi:(2Fe-2S) ferredoxin
MSTNKYIIQNCSNSKYRITINGTSHLSVGETWNIECDVIENGCYQILKDDSNVKFEVNVDDCSFIEYGTCYQCEEDNTPLNETILTESVCESSSPGYVGQFIRENSSGTPSDTYLITKLIPMLPPYPDPNMDAPINYGSVRLDRTPLGGGDLDSLFNSLNGLNNGTLIFNNVSGELAEYTITSTTYNNSYLEVFFGELISTEFTSFVDNSSYGICINESTPSNTPTPTVSITTSITPTNTPTISTTPTLTPSELSGVRVPTYAYVALLYDCNGNGPYEFAIETNYYDDIILPTNISWYFEHSDGNCYELTFPFNVNTTETVNAETPEWSNVYIGPSEMQINSCCDIGDCVSATTVGSYMFTDCCGIARAGNSINETFCVDTSLFYEGLNLTNSSCVQQCDEGPLSVVYSATSSCNRPGSIYIEVDGGTQPYNVQNITPGTLPSQTGLGPFEYSNIPEGTYVFNIFDSTLPESRQTALTVVISDCLETTITSANIDCEGGLGTITVSGSSESYPIIYQLYRYGGLYNTITANNNLTTFINLPEGEYYCVVTDSLFESNQTDTVTIEDDSNNIEFDLLITGDSQCGQEDHHLLHICGLMDKLVIQLQD